MAESNEIPDEPVIEDVLPSFSMHTYMLSRNIGEEDSSPPEYEEMVNTSGTSGEEYDPSKWVLNNVNQLKSKKVPLEIKITLTRRQPVVGQPYASESRMREYRPGEYVTGFVTVKNTGSWPVPFEMFLVSFEGNSGVPHIGRSPRKRFLNTYDLNACFHPNYGHALTGMHGIITSENYVDSDGVQVGFPMDQQFLPGTTYKKFFTFVVPHRLLDTACERQLDDHLELPPSFGVDSYWNCGKAAGLQASFACGYALSSDENGPVKANDFSVENMYISYAVRVQLICKDGSDFLLARDLHRHVRIATRGFGTSIKTAEQQLAEFEALFVPTEHNEANDIEKGTSDPVPIPSQLPFESCCFAKITKGLFKKTTGVIKVIATAKNLSMHSFCPSGFVNDPSSSSSSCKSSEQYSQEIVLHLEFSGDDPPSRISLVPSLIGITLASHFPIPVALDDSFVLKNGESLFDFKKKYFNLWNSLVSSTHERWEIEGLKSLLDLQRYSHHWRSLFEKVSLSPSWNYNGTCYEATTKFSLEVSKAGAFGIYMLPNFHSCRIGRWYQVCLEIGNSSIKLPIQVQ